MSERLAVGGTVTLDANGAGSRTFGPARQTEHWSVDRYTTSGASAANPRCQVFRGASALLDTTPKGNSDVSETTGLELRGGEFLTVAYTGGTAGAVMTFYLEGDVDYGV